MHVRVGHLNTICVLLLVLFSMMSIIITRMNNSTAIEFHTTNDHHLLSETKPLPNSSNITMRYIIREWNSLFECVVLTVINSDHHNQTNCVENTGKTQLLLVNTYCKLNEAPLQYSYHHILSLRRQIMIIIHHTPSITSDEYHQFVYSNLVHLFIIIYHDHMNVAKHNRYPWHHVHISKAAGRAIRATFRYVHNIFGDHNNINRADYNPASYNHHSYNLHCNEQYQLQRIYNSYIQRENPMMSYSDDHLFMNNTRDTNHKKPSICRKFIYLLAFREPIERICSQTAQMNSLLAFGGRNFLRTQSSYNRTDKKQNHCYNEPIVINGITYRLLVGGVDYRGLYQSLIHSEMSNFKNIYSITDVARVNDETSTLKRYKLWQFEVPDCFRNKEAHLFPLEQVTHLNESEFILVNTREFSWSNVQWIRTKVASNIYTSWLGYNDSKHSKFSLLANYVRREDIHSAHFINAMQFMLKVDYVLPFTNQNVNESVNIKH
eukprot:843812_1